MFIFLFIINSINYLKININQILVSRNIITVTLSLGSLFSTVTKILIKLLARSIFLLKTYSISKTKVVVTSYF